MFLRRVHQFKYNIENTDDLPFTAFTTPLILWFWHGITQIYLRVVQLASKNIKGLCACASVRERACVYADLA